MDSLTQIVLGAAVGEAVLGKKVRNKAMLYGAIAGTIPDLDVLASNFTDTVSALEIHRGFTHSIVFSIVFAPIFGWLVSKIESFKSFKSWSWLFFWAFITHPLLDAHTTWGTQLFWPFDLRLAYKNIFVVDPIYTLPFLVCLLLALFSRRTNPKRQFFNKLGLILSSTYLVITLFLKWAAFSQFKQALNNQNIDYIDIDTRPSPLNTILWNANIDTKDVYLLGDYSFFDSQPISFSIYEKNHHLIDDLKHNEKVQRMIAITEGWYSISQKNGNLYFNDLRFGLLNLKPESDDFVFQFLIEKHTDGTVNFIEQPRNRSNAKGMLNSLWQRIKGN